MRFRPYEITYKQHVLYVVFNVVIVKIQFYCKFVRSSLETRNDTICTMCKIYPFKCIVVELERNENDNLNERMTQLKKKKKKASQISHVFSSGRV